MGKHEAPHVHELHGQRIVDVTDWDLGDVAEYACDHRKRGEPAVLEINYGRGEKDFEFFGDSDEPFVALVIGEYVAPPPPTVVDRREAFKAKYGFYPEEENPNPGPAFDPNLLDLPTEPDNEEVPGE